MARNTAKRKSGFLFLESGEILEEISNATIQGGLIAIFAPAQDGSPHGHIPRSVGGQGLAKAQDTAYIFFGKLATMSFREAREVCGRSF